MTLRMQPEVYEEFLEKPGPHIGGGVTCNHYALFCLCYDIYLIPLCDIPPFYHYKQVLNIILMRKRSTTSYQLPTIIYLLCAGYWIQRGSTVRDRLAMTLAVAELLNPNKTNRGSHFEPFCSSFCCSCFARPRFWMCPFSGVRDWLAVVEFTRCVFFFYIYNFYPGSGSGYACSSPTASILHVVLVQISIVRKVMPS